MRVIFNSVYILTYEFTDERNAIKELSEEEENQKKAKKRRYEYEK